ncbi:MAG: TraX family protein, partial [Ruoffia tabacinasalis]
TLFSGLFAIWCIEKFEQPIYRFVGVVLSLAFVFILDTDYSTLGVSVIIILYVLRDFRLFQSLFGAFAFIGSWFAMPAFIITYFYNGLKGNLSSKAFYWFYPVHLLLYALIAYLLLS